MPKVNLLDKIISNMRDGHILETTRWKEVPVYDRYGRSAGTRKQKYTESQDLNNVPRGPWMNMSPEQQAKWEKAMSKGQKNFNVEFGNDGERTYIPSDAYPAFQRVMGQDAYPANGGKPTFTLGGEGLDELLEANKSNPHQWAPKKQRAPRAAKQKEPYFEGLYDDDYDALDRLKAAELDDDSFREAVYEWVLDNHNGNRQAFDAMMEAAGEI